MCSPASGRGCTATQKPEEGEKVQELETLKTWLETYPGWDSEVCRAEYTEGTPGNSGLFSQGLEEVSRREDVLGNLQVRCRRKFRLLRMASSEQGQQQAQWMRDFEAWVQAQSAKGLCPRFGDDPHGAWIRAEKGKLAQIRQTGSHMYEVILTAEFTKYYEVM